MHYKLKGYKLRSRRWFRKVEKRYRNHPRIVPILAGAAVIGIVIILGITLRDSAVTLKKRDANIVILHYDNQTQILPTREVTVADFLKNAGIEVREGDVVEPSLDAAIEEDDFRVNVYRGAPVIIRDRGKTITAISAGQTPRTIAAQAGVKLFAEDIVTTAPSQDFLREGIAHKLSIKRSVPVNINLYGTPLALRTHAKTVRELLNEKNVKLEEDDNVKPSLDTRLKDKLQIFVTRFGTKVVTTSEVIPVPIETRDDNTLSFGTTVLRQQGSPGKKSVTYQLEIKNGREIERKLIQEVIVTEPVKQIVARGTLVSIPSDKTSVMNSAGIPSSQHKYVNYIFSRESGWDAARISANGCIGLGQNCPSGGSYWLKDSCPNWQTDPVCQTKRFTAYAGRYGGWEGAYNFWLSHHWW